MGDPINKVDPSGLVILTGGSPAQQAHFNKLLSGISPSQAAIDFYSGFFNTDIGALLQPGSGPIVQLTPDNEMGGTGRAGFTSHDGSLIKINTGSSIFLDGYPNADNQLEALLMHEIAHWLKYRGDCEKDFPDSLKQQVKDAINNWHNPSAKAKMFLDGLEGYAAEMAIFGRFVVAGDVVIVPNSSGLVK